MRFAFGNSELGTRNSELEIFMKNAVLITIGKEVLSGTTVDTNYNFIAKELSKIGISISIQFS